MSLIAAAALVLTTQMPEGKPEELSRLRPGELVRIYKTGGLTPRGPFFSQMAITESGKVFLRDVDGRVAGNLDSVTLTQVRTAVRQTSWAKITAAPRSEPYGPSAYDGTDIHVSFLQNGKRRYWNNIKWHHPEQFELLETLRGISDKLRG